MLYSFPLDTFFFHLLQILARDQSDIGVVERRLHEMGFFLVNKINIIDYKMSLKMKL